MNALVKVNANSTIHDSTPRLRKGPLRWLVWIACVPLGFILVVLFFLSVREYRASLSLQNQIALWNHQGVPYDNASMDAWYRKNTFEEGAAEWMKIMDCVTATSSDEFLERLPIVGQRRLPDSLDPNAVWEDEPLVAEYLKEVDPILKQIRRANHYPTPIRFPIDFQGFHTLLPHIEESRAIARLLQLDFEYAFYHRDAGRALQDLHLMTYSANTIDSGLFLVGNLVVAASTSIKRHAIRRSMEHDFWDKTQLEELRDILGPPRYSPEKWKFLFDGEYGMCFDAILRGDVSELIYNEADRSIIGWLPIMPSGKMQLVQYYNNIKDLRDQTLSQLKESASALEEKMLSESGSFDLSGSAIWKRLLAPGINTHYCHHMENDENDRRLTLTTIALRQFKQTEGRWPNRLAELERFGLGAEVYTTVNGGILGYEVTDDVAYVWSFTSFKETKVPDVRPRRDPQEVSDWFPPLSTLR